MMVCGTDLPSGFRSLISYQTKQKTPKWTLKDDTSLYKGVDFKEKEVKMLTNSNKYKQSIVSNTVAPLNLLINAHNSSNFIFKMSSFCKNLNTLGKT